MSTNRIIKNSLVMYLVIIGTALIGIYNSRIILSTLGIEDFGIYSLIYGIVLLFSFMNSSMSGTVQRFLSVSIGKKDNKELSEYICSAILIHFIIAIFVLLIGKTIGEWFLTNKIVISIDKKNVGYWVYQIALLSFFLQILSTPAQALLTAQEKMGFTSIINSITCLGKLISILIITKIKPENSLVLFCLFCLLFSCIQIITFYIISGIIHKISYSLDFKKFKELAKFATWSLFGDLSSVAKSQGSAVILNLFFGAPINAAFGIANQVCGNLNNVSNMVTKAANPQIIMFYNSKNKEKAYKLVAQLSKITFSLLFTISLPFLLMTNEILILWLKKVPEHSIQFTQLSIITSLIEVCSIPLMVLSKATGKIKLYQTIVGGILLLNIPISYFVLLITKIPESIYFVFIANSIFATISRLLILKKTARLSLPYFLSQVYLKIFLLIIIIGTYIFVFNYFFKINNFMTYINYSIIVPLLSFMCTVFFVLSKNEKTKLLTILNFQYKKIHGGI